MNEIYKTIEGFPNYEASNMGNIRNKKTKRILKAGKDAGDYLRVVLYNNGKPSTKKVHRLVLETFNPIEGMKELHCDHIDFNRQNNCLENLRWLTPTGNDSKKSGSNRKKVLCVETVITYDSVTAASEQTGINLSNISQCCLGKRKTAGGYHWQFVG